MPYTFAPDHDLTDAEVTAFIAAFIGVVSDDVYAQVQTSLPWLIPYLQAIPEVQ